MMRWIVICLVFLAAAPLRAETNIEATLQCLVSNSTLVVSASIASEPSGVMREQGVVHYSFDIQIVDVLYGTKPKDEKIHIQMTRFETGKEDALPFLKKGAKCIVFLWQWEYSSVPDMWFGIQPFNSHMASRIKELSPQQKK